MPLAEISNNFMRWQMRISCNSAWDRKISTASFCLFSWRLNNFGSNYRLSYRKQLNTHIDSTHTYIYLDCRSILVFALYDLFFQQNRFWQNDQASICDTHTEGNRSQGNSKPHAELPHSTTNNIYGSLCFLRRHLVCQCPFWRGTGDNRWNRNLWPRRETNPHSSGIFHESLFCG